MEPSRRPVLPISHGDWQVLRSLVRAKRRPILGKDLRLNPSRRTKDGTFLFELVKRELLEVVHKEKDPFLCTFTLTELGQHAAEYGECEWISPN